MSKLDELIQELCPNGVEFKTVGDVAAITRGRVMSKDYIKENQGIYPVYSSQTENNGELGYISTYDFDKLMPPVSRFGGGGRAKKKQGITQKLKEAINRKKLAAGGRKLTSAILLPPHQTPLHR